MAIIRVTSCSLLISRLNIAVAIPLRTATWWAILRTNAVLPMAGLAATSINSDPWRPVSILSRSMNPVGIPVTLVFFLEASSICSITFMTILSIPTNLLEPFLSFIRLNTPLSACSRSCSTPSESR